MYLKIDFCKFFYYIMTEVIQRFSDFTKKILYNQKSKCIECQKFYGTNYNLFMCSLCFYKFKNISPPKEYELDMEKFWKENNYKIFPSDIFDDICKSENFCLRKKLRLFQMKEPSFFGEEFIIVYLHLACQNNKFFHSRKYRLY